MSRRSRSRFSQGANDDENATTAPRADDIDGAVGGDVGNDDLANDYDDDTDMGARSKNTPLSALRRTLSGSFMKKGGGKADENEMLNLLTQSCLQTMENQSNLEKKLEDRLNNIYDLLNTKLPQAIGGRVETVGDRQFTKLNMENDYVPDIESVAQFTDDIPFVLGSKGGNIFDTPDHNRVLEGNRYRIREDSVYGDDFDEEAILPRLKRLEIARREGRSGAKYLEVPGITRIPRLPPRLVGNKAANVAVFKHLLNRFTSDESLRYRVGMSPLIFISRIFNEIERAATEISHTQAKSILENLLDKQYRDYMIEKYTETKDMDYLQYAQELYLTLGDRSSAEQLKDKFYTFDFRKDPEVVNLVTLTTRLTRLGNRAELNSGDIINRLYHILPEFAKSHIDLLRQKYDDNGFSKLSTSVIFQQLSPIGERIADWMRQQRNGKRHHEVHQINANIEPRCHEKDYDVEEKYYIPVNQQEVVSQVQQVQQVLQVQQEESKDADEGVHYTYNNKNYKQNNSPRYGERPREERYPERNRDDRYDRYDRTNDRYTERTQGPWRNNRNNFNRTQNDYPINQGNRNQNERGNYKPTNGRTTGKVITCVKCLQDHLEGGDCKSVVRCVLCNGECSAAACLSYPGTSAVGDPCNNCLDFFNLKLFHTEQDCKLAANSNYSILGKLDKRTKNNDILN